MKTSYLTMSAQPTSETSCVPNNTLQAVGNTRSNIRIIHMMNMCCVVVVTRRITNSMEQSLSLDACCRLTSQEIPRILHYPGVHY